MKTSRLDPKYMPCYAEGDWESVVSFFQAFLRKDREKARVVANAERAKALNYDDAARIQLYDMGAIKVWRQSRDTQSLASPIRTVILII